MAQPNDRKSAAVVALVGSAGGLPAIEAVISRLPPGLPVPVLVLLHLMHDRPSHAAAILDRKATLPVRQAADGDRLEPGHVYVAPPDAHLRVLPDHTLEVDHEAAAVDFQRPSADVLLRSLVGAYDGGAVAVVLSGMGSDGAEGAEAIHVAGGTVFAQDAATALHHSMPAAAIATGAVDYVLSPAEIAAAIVERVGMPA